MNNSWDVRCSSLLKIGPSPSHSLKASWDTGLSLTVSRKHYSWLSYRRSLKFAKLTRLTISSSNSSRESLNASVESIFKLRIEPCASLRMTTSLTFLRLTRTRPSPCLFLSSATSQKTTGTRFSRSLLLLSRLSWRRLTLSLSTKPSRWLVNKENNMPLSKMKKIDKLLTKNGAN